MPRNFDRDISISLQDQTEDTLPNFSERVWLLKDGFLNSFKDEYQRVRIPMSKFLPPAGYSRDRFAGVVFGGSHREGHNFYVDDMNFEVDEPAPTNGEGRYVDISERK